MEEKLSKEIHPISPIYDENSKVLILGSFPSKLSRKVNFYYGNPQNHFWKMLFGFFGENIPESSEEKKAFLLKNGIALWDTVIGCEIVGSSDASIQNYQTANLSCIFEKAKIKLILLNGKKAYDTFIENYADCKIPYIKMQSTSSANPRYNQSEWHKELNGIFSVN